MLPSREAQQCNEQGRDLQEAGQFDEAADAYRRAVALAPDWATPLYNLGLICKHQKMWQQSLDYNRQAAALDPANQPAWWNMGIAATATGNWALARQAWRGFGIALPEGEGPIDFPCGISPIRLNPEGDGEVVWGHRLDPARMVLLSVPLPESGYCWGDTVLNDGAPVGHRQYQGREVPVFNALEILEASECGTFVAQVRLPPDEALIRQLAEIAARQHGAAEDWSSSVKMICRACSEGRPHETHETSLPEGAHQIGIAARDRAHATAILREWETGRKDIHVEWLEAALVRHAAESE